MFTISALLKYVGFFNIAELGSTNPHLSILNKYSLQWGVEYVWN